MKTFKDVLDKHSKKDKPKVVKSAPGAQAAPQPQVPLGDLPPREIRRRFNELGMIYHEGNRVPGPRKSLGDIIDEYNRPGSNDVKDKIEKMNRKKKLHFRKWIKP